MRQGPPGRPMVMDPEQRLGCALNDRVLWRQANPALGVRSRSRSWRTCAGSCRRSVRSGVPVVVGRAGRRGAPDRAELNRGRIARHDDQVYVRDWKARPHGLTTAALGILDGSAVAVAALTRVLKTS